MKIGFIGSGNIGGAVGELMARAGHEVFLHAIPTTCRSSPASARGRARNAEGSVAFADVVFLGVPYSSMPQIGQDYAAALKGRS